MYAMDRRDLDELRKYAADTQLEVKPENHAQKIFLEKARNLGKATLTTAALTRPTPKSIIFFRSQTCPCIFKQLSADENGIIFDTFLNVLDDKPTKTIHDLLFLCKPLSTFILSRRNTLRLTKELSFTNKCSNETAVEMIQTKTARKYLMTQKGFEQMCGQGKNATISKQNARVIKTCGTDINFTYENYSENQLVKACKKSPEQKPLIARWLLENGADTTVRTDDNDPILLYLLDSSTDLSNEILSYFFASPSFDINHYYQTSRLNITVTTTIFYMFFMFILAKENVSWYEKSELSDQQKFQLKRLQLLLDNGADPELSGSMGMEPLLIVKALKNQTLIDMFEKAIENKTKTQKAMKKIRQPVKKRKMSLEQAAQEIHKRSFKK
jgi:hypothetical protein